jgi:hypothetical protein
MLQFTMATKSNDPLGGLTPAEFAELEGICHLCGEPLAPNGSCPQEGGHQYL